MGTDVIFAIISDSGLTAPVVAEYLMMGEIEEVQDLLEYLRDGAEPPVVKDEIRAGVLTVWRELPMENGHLLERYYRCYPYYLMLRTAVVGKSEIPESTRRALESVEVTR